MAAIAVDLDGLFGLLRLPDGLIDQVQLVAAVQAWTRRGAAGGRALVGRGDLDAEQRSGVEAMVALHLRKRCGDAEEILAPLPGEVTEGEA